MNTHPDPKQLRRWCDGRLEEAECRVIESHLESCSDVCQPLLDQLAAPEDTPAPRRALSGPVGAEKLPALPGYEMLEVIGRGGMGVVYKARQVGLDRLVALKMVLAGPHAAPEDLARFRTEGEAIARLQHPNIVQIYEIGEHDGRPFFSMEYCPGGSLEGKAGSPMRPAEAAGLVATLAQAMQAAHDKGIVHRDLKPANVLLGADGTPKISDFGLAKKLDVEQGHTQSGAIMGTPSYMAPEQARGTNREVGSAADVHALGAVLYELLTGRPPFLAASVVDTILQVLTEDPLPVRRLQPSVPRDLETIALKCLQKPPGRRYHSASELADDLHRWQVGKPIRARPVGAAERFWMLCWRHKVVTGLVALFFLSVVAGTVGSVSFAVKATREKVVAQRAEKRTRTALNMSRGAIQVVARSRASLDTRAKTVLRDLVQKHRQLVTKPGITEEERFRAAQEQLDIATIISLISELGEIEAEYRQAIDLYEQLAGDYPGTEQYRDELARCYFNLGLVLHQQGKLQQAEAAYRRALDFHRRLAEEVPQAPLYRGALADDYNNLGAVLRDGKQLPQAEAVYRQAIALGERLIEEVPDFPPYRSSLAANYHNLGNAVRDQGQVKAALAWYGKAIALFDPNKPAADDVKLILRNAYWDRANALGQLGRHLEARQDWQKAIVNDAGPARFSLRLFMASAEKEVQLQAQKKPDGKLLYETAAIQARAAAAAGKEEEELGKRYANRALELLKQARAAGLFRDPQWVQRLKADQYLTALPRAEFKPFLESLTAGKGKDDPPGMQ